MSLRSARVNANLTQQDVKEKTGIARSTLTRWERNQTTPSEKNKEVLCKLYDTSPEKISWQK